MQKKNNWILLVSIVIIAALCWIENEYFTEANDVSEARRKFVHIAFLVVIMLVGYAAWYKQPLKWLRKLWLMAYLFAVSFIILIGVINATTHIFGEGFLDVVRSFRIFFCSPVPFLALLVLGRIGNAMGGKPTESPK